jgi:prevent-host-death family protein
MRVKVMAKQFSISDAKNRLPSLVHAIEHGPEIQLTRHGKPVAVLISMAQYKRLIQPPKNFWADLHSFRESVDTDSLLSSDDNFFEDRPKSPGRPVSFEK